MIVNYNEEGLTSDCSYSALTPCNWHKTPYTIKRIVCNFAFLLKQFVRALYCCYI